MTAVPTRLTTWYTILRISLEERMVYRADFIVATFIRFLPVVTQVFFWSALFQSMRGDTMVGYSYHDVIAYYLLTMVTRAVSSMPNLSAGIAQQVRDGEIKKFLVQPVDFLGFLLLMRIAHKLVYYVMAAIPFAIVFYCLRDYFPGWPSAVVFGQYLLALLFSFLIGFFLEAAIGLVAFWWLEVNSMLFIYMLLTFFLSGHMFPLDMLPEPFQSIVRVLPLQHLAYSPSAIFLGKITGHELNTTLLNMLFWTVFFFILCRILYARGVKRYSGFGG